MSANSDLQRRLGSIEELLHNVESTADPSLRASVQELIELVMQLHGAGLERMIELVRATGGAGEALIRKLTADDLVASLLVLHGIHPLSLEDRVTQALEKTRSRLRPHGGEVELLNVQDGAVRVRLEVKSQGCGSTGHTLKEMVEDAVYQAAPDLTALTIEGAEEKQGFVPLAMLLNGHPVPAAKGGL
jgi:Fe-S cluster biogenesis protein NfuA